VEQPARHLSDIDGEILRAEFVELRQLLELSLGSYRSHRREARPAAGTPGAVALLWDVIGFSESFSLESPEGSDPRGVAIATRNLFDDPSVRTSVLALLPANARLVEVWDEGLCVAANDRSDPSVYKVWGPTTDAGDDDRIELCSESCVRYLVTQLLDRCEAPVWALVSLSEPQLPTALDHLVPGARRLEDVWLLPVGADRFEIRAPSVKTVVAFLEEVACRQLTSWQVFGQPNRRTKRTHWLQGMRRIPIAGPVSGTLHAGDVAGVPLLATQADGDEEVALRFDIEHSASIEHLLSTGRE
jgi:hypothetical protein